MAGDYIPAKESKYSSGLTHCSSCDFLWRECMHPLQSCDLLMSRVTTYYFIIIDNSFLSVLTLCGHGRVLCFKIIVKKKLITNFNVKISNNIQFEHPLHGNIVNNKSSKMRKNLISSLTALMP